MGKVFRYELRRLLLNKFFIGLLVINVLYAWIVLASVTVAGVAYTAPFSPWSYGAYLASALPVSILTVFFLLSSFYSKKEKRVAALTAATPVNPAHYMLLRTAAVALGFALICALEMGISVYFYVSYFDYWRFAAFLVPSAVTLIPCFVFAAGAGHLAGRLHQGFLYLLLAVSLALGSAKLPAAFDFFGGGYFESAPMSLPAGPDGEPAFTLSAAFLTARAVYLAAGAVLLALSVRGVRRKARKATP